MRVDLEFNQHIEEFRSTYLRRVVLFLAVTVWAAAAPVLLVGSSLVAVAVAGSFQVLCGLTLYLLHRGRSHVARYVFSLGAVAWLFAIITLLRQPVLLVLPLLLAPVIATQLEPAQAVVGTGLLALGGLGAGLHVFGAGSGNWEIWIFPLLTVLVTTLVLIREADVQVILGWALQSTRAAIDRLTEVQEHRARLYILAKDLDNAYHRLERVNGMLAAARAEAEEAQQARQQFALIVSHELRTPLNFIIGFSELMANSPATYGDPSQWPPGLYDDIREIYRSSSHLLRLVNDVLDLGKTEARRLVLVKEWVTPATLVEEALTIVAAAAKERHLHLDTEVQTGLPELFVDRTRIRQVLINLLGNSLWFTEEGGITVMVTGRVQDVVFCVRDTGPGIAPEELAKVFEEFGQARSTVWRRREGTGLGMPISKRLVTLHGGEMWLESEVGRGSAVYFTLPLPGYTRNLPEPSDMDVADYWHLVAQADRAKQITLVLSPDPTAADVLGGLLDGWQVVGAADVQTARQQIMALLPQSLLIDQAIAGQSDVMTLVRELPYDPPVIVLSLPGSAIHRRELPRGVVSSLTKPVVHGDLRAALAGLGIPLRRVLAVDDDPAMAHFVQLTLREWDGGIEVTSVLTGREALQYLQETPELPDAVLLDISLPDMSGWDLLQVLQAHAAWHGIPVIIVTAASLEEALDARERRTLTISTQRSLTAEELTAALTGLLAAIPPRSPADLAVPGVQGTLSG